MKEQQLKIEGMTCEHCVKAVASAIEEAGGHGRVSLAEKSAIVTYDESQSNIEKISKAIEEEGYKVLA